MSKGKYANASEARAVREGALSEVAAGRRKIVQLAKENAELRERLDSLLETYNAETRKLRIALAEGISPELEQLREDLADAQIASRNANKEVALAIVALFKSREDFVASQDFYAALNTELGLEPGELYADRTRYMRRLSPKMARSTAMAAEWARANGHGYKGQGRNENRPQD